VGCPFSIDQVAGLDLAAFVVGHAHLALRNAAGGEVQHERVAPLERHADAAGIGAVAAVAAVERRDHRPRLHVDEMDGHQAVADRHLGEMPDAAQVVRVGQRQDAAAQFLGAGHAQGHGLLTDHLPVAALAVQRQQAAAVEVHLGGGVGLEPAFEHGVHVARHHADPVRVVPAQVGQHQVGGNPFGFFLAAARCYQDSSYMCPKFGGLKCFWHEIPVT
jgi:hypothetical protein